MSTQIIYNGVDITKDVNVVSCVLIDSNGGKQDYCKISFANGGKIWNEWQPQHNDEVQIKHGYSDSGIMYVNGIESGSNFYSLVLLPTPNTAKKRKNKVWRDVMLSEIISDVAKEIGFKVEFYSFIDYNYKTKAQINQTDIAFMSEACALEGYKVKIYNKKIVIYEEKQLYHSITSETIKPEDCAFYKFVENNQPLSELTVKYYDALKNKFINYTAKSGIDGATSNVLIKVDNKAQAERYANNYLRSNNNYIDCGTIKLKNADNLASGCVISLENFVGYNGLWYIYESVFDTVNNDCVFKINKIRG